MATPAERKALLFLAAVVSLGAGVRVVRAVSRDPASDEGSTRAVREQIRRVDSAQRVRKGPGSPRRTRPGKSLASAALRPVDMDTSSAELMEGLNGIGPALARRIVANRDSLGAFGSIEGLGRVRGIGPALSAKLAPQVTFSRVPRPQNAVGAPPPGRRQAPGKIHRDRGFP
ncbi:MAG: helix-hairpin-helix domain-containing protein [Gemmatimonadaceae bacterium]|nr:helix-hairpin-helix domain-containing protein [Gemmatimonadaceae bacterium]